MRSQKDILLSICIPTYNRAPYLRVALKYAIDVINDMDGLVELIISDNCSDDGTFEILEGLPKYSWIHYDRMKRNEGAVKNSLNCLMLAKGEYVWFVGDDDVISPGGLIHIIDIIKEHIEIDYFVVNTINLGNDSRSNIDEIIQNKEILEKQKTKYTDLSNRKVISFNEFLDPIFDPIFLGSMMCNIIRRSVWQAGLKGFDAEAPFGTVEGTYPVCFVLARTMVGKPSYYIGYPCSMAFWGHQEWQGFLPLIFAHTFHRVLDYYEINGVESWKIEKCRRHLLLHSNLGINVFKLVFLKNTLGRDQFSLQSLVKSSYSYYQFWAGLLLQPIWRLICYLKQKIIYQNKS